MDKHKKTTKTGFDEHAGKLVVKGARTHNLKDITVEMLGDRDFGKAAAKAKLYLEEMYEQYEAARARR